MLSILDSRKCRIVKISLRNSAIAPLSLLVDNILYQIGYNGAKAARPNFIMLQLYITVVATI